VCLERGDGLAQGDGDDAVRQIARDRLTPEAYERDLADQTERPNGVEGLVTQPRLKARVAASSTHPEHLKLVEQSMPLAEVAVDDYDAVLLVGGQGPMFTFWDDERVHRLVASFYEARKVTAVICHATCVLLKTRLSDGDLLAAGKTWTGFANSEKRFADDDVGRKIQPFWIGDEAGKLENTASSCPAASSPTRSGTAT
jgi:putative intracellular protease/amidase